jgi:hypothetical protein
MSDPTSMIVLCYAEQLVPLQHLSGSAAASDSSNFPNFEGAKCVSDVCDGKSRVIHGWFLV